MTAGSATFVDPAGDAAGAPDISAVTVAHDDAGTLTFRIAVSDRTALVFGDQSAVFLNVDERLDTGATEFLGADVLLELVYDARFWLRRWNGSTFPLDPSPSASLTAAWSEGYRFSIALAELGSPRRIGFMAITLATPGGLVARDQLIGGYDTQTGEAIDPLPEPPPDIAPPSAPQGVRASRARRDGVRIEWKASAGASKYEVWRSRTRSGRGLRVGTTTRTTFLDKRVARRIPHYYAARAGNADGWSPFSRKVLGTRR